MVRRNNRVNSGNPTIYKRGLSPIIALLLRPFVVGRKAWLFADTVGGATASANLYSLIETAKANGIEPYRYLKWLFTLLPMAKTVDDFTALLPWNMPPSEK